MVVISKTKLTEFGRKHADAIDPVNEWWEKTKAADWMSYADIKKTFNTVDYVVMTDMSLILREQSTGLSL